MKLSQEVFGSLADGRSVERYTLKNRQGIRVQILTWGAIISSIQTPDAQGKLADIVLGFDTLKDYLEKSPYFGCIVGRFANRLAHGQFSLDGKSYQLTQNDGVHHLHGGKQGFDKRLWAASIEGDWLNLSYSSPDGEEGYPGRLEARVSYRLNDANELHIRYEASSDKATLVNLSNHSYFNLAGSGSILEHELKLAAYAFTPVDKSLIPTGELRDVDGSAFDFRTPTAMGLRIASKDEQLEAAGGYDHNFVLSNSTGGLALAAAVREPRSGRGLEVWTTQGGIQFYSGNFLKPLSGKAGQVYDWRSGFCLETQDFPDNPHHPHFSQSILRPGQNYLQTTVFRFPAAPYQFS